MKNKKYTPKISFNVPEDLYNSYINSLDWGLRGRVMLELTSQLVSAIDKCGIQVVYLILAGKLNLFGLSKEE